MHNMQAKCYIRIFKFPKRQLVVGLAANDKLFVAEIFFQGVRYWHSCLGSFSNLVAEDVTCQIDWCSYSMYSRWRDKRKDYDGTSIVIVENPAANDGPLKIWQHQICQTNILMTHLNWFHHLEMYGEFFLLIEWIAWMKLRNWGSPVAGSSAPAPLAEHRLRVVRDPPALEKIGFCWQNVFGNLALGNPTTENTTKVLLWSLV